MRNEHDRNNLGDPSLTPPTPDAPVLRPTPSPVDSSMTELKLSPPVLFYLFDQGLMTLFSERNDEFEMNTSPKSP